MSYLVDTHLLIWAAVDLSLVPEPARTIITDPAETIVFSVVTIWETAIKSGLGKPDFNVDPAALRAGLIAEGCLELPVVSAHAIAVQSLPHHHRDPFDRMLIAQARGENLTLLTADRRLGAYGNPVRIV